MRRINSNAFATNLCVASPRASGNLDDGDPSLFAVLPPREDDGAVGE
jgi:hypothetical protein